MRHAGFLPALLSVTALSVFAQGIDTLNPAPNGPPATVAVQADGRILIAGSFLQVGATPCERMARLNADGSLDTAFCANVSIDSDVNSIAVQADGKILIGGGFGAVGTSTRHGLARLNADGTVDTTFADPGFDGTVWAIALQPDGKVLAAGSFQHSGATARGDVARLTSTGVLDTTFADPQIPASTAFAVAVQPDGHVVVGGYFDIKVGSTTYFYLVRYSAAGVFDTGFPAASYTTPLTYGLLVAPDGSIYVNGSGNMQKITANGIAASGFSSPAVDGEIETFALQPDGKILVGGTFQNISGQPRHGVARLNANGSLDTTFGDLQFSLDAIHPNGYVYGLAAQANGSVVTIGNFTLADSQSRQYVARFSSSDAAVSTLTGQASGSDVIVTWTRTGSGAELTQAPVLSHSTDGVTYTPIGAMTRAANGWQYTAHYDYNGAPFYLQGSGLTTNGANNGSASRIDSPVFSNDGIFRDGFEGNP